MSSNDQTAAQETPMQLAEILSDLVSLRVCDPAAALALVSVRAPTSTSQNPTSDDTTQKSNNDEVQDKDIKRAKDIVELHYSVREAHKRGELAQGLMEAREAVERAVG